MIFQCGYRRGNPKDAGFVQPSILLLAYTRTSQFNNSKSTINDLDPTCDVPKKKFEGMSTLGTYKIPKEIKFETLIGKSIALVCVSGSDKYMSILLAQRLYSANSEKIGDEGISVCNWDVIALYDNMAIAAQEPVLFNCTITENILYGKSNATQQEIEEAAKEANIYNFATNLPNGFDTSVYQKSGSLPDDQRQHNIIAHALVRKPKLMLLNEATVDLDLCSEEIVQKVLGNVSKERITLKIAHRLSTIQGCDIIIVIKNGRIVECGAHDEHLTKKGVYFSFVQRQSLQVIH